MKKYLLLAVMALAAVGMLLTGCTNGSSGWDPEDDYGKTVTVTFDANGMGTAPAPMKTRVGNFIWLPKMEDINDFVHVSWYKDRARQLSAGNVDTRFYPADDVTLYAYWTDVKYAVKWDMNYALNSGEKPIADSIVAAGTNVVVQGALATRDDGTEFAGWFTEKEVTPEIQPVTSDIIVDSDKVFYAQWKSPVTVKWMVNGSEYTKGLQEQRVFTNLKVPTIVPEPVDGKAFGGWYTAVESGDVVDENTMVYSAVTYYAQFGYKVTLYDSEEAGIAGITKGGTFISGVTATKPGYVIVGYYTGPTFDVMLAGPDMTLLPNVSGYTDASGRYIANTDTTLYIKWAKKMAGTIYYADQTNGYGKDNYTFYDAAGKKLYVEEAQYGVTFWTDSGKSAKAEVAYYDVTGKTAGDKDRYYAAGTKLATTYPWTFGQTDAAVSTNNYFTENLQTVLGGAPLHTSTAANYQGTNYLGRGKADTETMLYRDPNDENADDEYGPYAGGKYLGNTFATMDKYPTVFTALADYRTTTGVDDWFIPSASELWLLTQNASVRVATGWMSGRAWSSSVYGVGTSDSWSVSTDGTVNCSGRNGATAVVLVRAF
ncbi:MAG: InlB B-repeat-containing protein [Spirochaetia bacterium]|nr:InlB B-repeat-containing protein [Spirochaetia bacterium]